MLQRLRNRDDEGFTLVELLIVVIILGILAAIVVFAVGGITNNSQTAACQQDAKTLQSAEEAYFAQNGKYAAETTLQPTYIHQQSTLYSVTLTGTSPNFTAYALAPIGTCPANP